MSPELGAPAGGAAVLFFWLAALLAVVGAAGTVLFRSPIRGAVGLLANILALAALFVLLSAHLLAAIQVIVYAGAVVVLFVFVIMVLGPAAEPSGTGARGLVASVLSVGVLAYFGYRLFGALAAVRRGATAPDGFGTVAGLGDAIFGRYLFQFEAISVLLLVAIVGAVAVAKGKSEEKDAA